jgi:mannose-6-phosphate isomerase-like protein (cupin superfamily)
MDNNHLNHHICHNHTRSVRNKCGRIENEMSHCNLCKNKCPNEHGGEIYALNIEKLAYKNNNFRESIWTGKYLQATLMSILPKENIGAEIHEDTDQYIRVEGGCALLLTGNDKNCLTDKKQLYRGDAVFIPAGTWHDIVNIGKCKLRLSSIYAPPHHPKCTEEKFKIG